MIDYIQHFSYLAIFIITFFAGYIIPIPEEIILLVTGYLASQSIISLPIAIAICVTSLILSDNLLFRLCLTENCFVKKMHDRVFRLKLMKYRDNMIKHIDKTIFVSRFTPFLRFVGPVVAASIKTPKKDFFVFNTFAVLIYAPVLILIGYIFSNHLKILIGHIETLHQAIVHVTFLGILFVGGVWITYHLNRKLGDPLNSTISFSKEGNEN